MRFSRVACIVLLMGFVVTTLINTALWNYVQNDLDKQYQYKSDIVFDSSRDALIQHRIITDALRALFNASDDISEVEFSLFAKNLLKIKSAVAFTLSPALTPVLISDPVFKSTIEKGKAETDENGNITFVIDSFSSIVMNIDEPKMPYIVYAVSLQEIQQRIDQYSNVCARVTFSDKTLSNRGCNKEQNWTEIFGFHAEQFIDLPEYGTSLNLTVDYVPTKKELLGRSLLILVITLLGVGLSVLFFILVQHRININKQRIETNSKFALLSTLNHEIRTPINAVLGYANMLNNMACDDAQRQNTVEKIIWSANLLNSVAQNTLTYTKASSGSLTLYYEKVDLIEYLYKIDDYYRAFGSTHKKQLMLNLRDATPPHILLDTTKFFQLTTNLVNNAFKYSSGDTVILDVKVKAIKDIANRRNAALCTQVDGFIRVSVRDFGKGMSAASQQALSKPFTTDDSSPTALKSGVGIGLYTCKTVIESVGGAIKIRSRKGKGTLVIFHFPYRVCSETEERVLVPQDNVAPARQHDRPLQVHTAQFIEQQSSVTKRQGRVLLVDDNRFNLEVCKAMLEDEGFDVTTAENEREVFSAMAALSDNRVTHNDEAVYDELIILMDYMLAETDGFTLIESMKAKGYRQQHYFILSAHTEDEIQKVKTFADIAFLQKPLDITLLKQKLPTSTMV
ncbi:MAG: ATP-binding protein [Photobacterium frigidiphilum]|uniref:ATP-binding protein n=1 Tax=Photobacterium frigidiphilum TaxID=264736 RepID=UPI00300261F4